MALYINSKISVIAHSNVRYEGVLVSIDQENKTIHLAQVRSMGTEDRQTPDGKVIAPANEVHELVVFKHSDIKEITIAQPSTTETPLASTMQTMPGLYYNPYSMFAGQQPTTGQANLWGQYPNIYGWNPQLQQYAAAAMQYQQQQFLAQQALQQQQLQPQASTSVTPQTTTTSAATTTQAQKQTHAPSSQPTRAVTTPSTSQSQATSTTTSAPTPAAAKTAAGSKPAQAQTSSTQPSTSQPSQPQASSWAAIARGAASQQPSKPAPVQQRGAPHATRGGHQPARGGHAPGGRGGYSGRGGLSRHAPPAPVAKELIDLEDLNKRFEKTKLLEEVEKEIEKKRSEGKTDEYVPAENAYSPDEFFDRISCAALERVSLDVDGEIAGPNAKQLIAEQKKLDVETFGPAALRSAGPGYYTAPRNAPSQASRGGSVASRGGGSNSMQWRSQPPYSGRGGYHQGGRSNTRGNYSNVPKHNRPVYHKGTSTNPHQRPSGGAHGAQQQGQKQHYRPTQRTR